MSKQNYSVARVKTRTQERALCEYERGFGKNAYECKL